MALWCPNADRTSCYHKQREHPGLMHTRPDKISGQNNLADLDMTTQTVLAWLPLRGDCC
jgi:hypothetical protein